MAKRQEPVLRKIALSRFYWGAALKLFANLRIKTGFHENDGRLVAFSYLKNLRMTPLAIPQFLRPMSLEPNVFACGFAKRLITECARVKSDKAFSVFEF